MRKNLKNSLELELMRVGIDATIIENKQPTGMAVYALNVIQELAKLCNDLVVWVVEDEILNIPCKFKRPVLQGFKKLKSNFYLARAVWAQVYLPKLLLKEKADIFFSPIPEGILNPPIPQVVVMHDLVPIFYPKDAPLLRRLSFRYRIPNILKNSAGIIAVSHFTKKEMCRFYKINKEKIFVIHEGYDKEHFKPQPSHKMQSILDKYNLFKDNYILFIGNFTPRKNILNLIRAYKILVDKGYDKFLVLAGNKNVNKNYTQKIEQLVEELNLKEKVRFLDYVPYADLPALYSGASVFVYPSYYEGFGLPILEAMACGTPVATSTRSSLSEICGNSVLSAEPKNVKEMALKILQILDDRNLSKALIHRGLERVKFFSWSQTASKILKVMQKTIYSPKAFL